MSNLNNVMLLERLKTETRPDHDQLESVVGLAATLEAHRLQLERFYGFVQEWEPAVERVCEAQGFPPKFWEPRRKMPRLEADLRYFGYDAPTLRKLPSCLALPLLSTAPQMLGSLYVLEGATLGGQIISRHLEQSLGLTGGQGYSFFQGYGPETGSRWKAFGQILLNYAGQYPDTNSGVAAAMRLNPQPNVNDSIVQSARATFASLHRWFASENEMPTL